MIGGLGRRRDSQPFVIGTGPRSAHLVPSENDRGETTLRIKTKLAAIAGTIAIAGGLAAVATPAGAAPLPKVDASSHSVTCNDLIGKIKFGIPLHLGGTSANTVTVSVKSSDCVDNTAGAYDPTLNPTGVSLKGFSSKGVLNSSNNDCLGLSGLSTGTSGAIAGKFTTNPQTPGLVNATNTINVTQTYGGTFNDGGTTSPASDSDSWGGQYGLFQIGADSFMPTTAPVVTGAYNNGGGANLQFDGTTAQSQGTLATQCFSTAGIKGIQFGIGGFTS
jgi:hypothetical protein